jgi:hypothetical protein
MHGRREKRKGSSAAQGPTPGKMWRILSFILLSTLSILTWYFNHCYNDRKKAVENFKQAHILLKTTEEPFAVTASDALAALESYNEYLLEGEITPAVIGHRQSITIPVLERANSDCNRFKDASYRFLSAWKDLTDLFVLNGTYPLPTEEKYVSAQCANWGEMLQYARKADAKKISSDPSVRNRAARALEQLKSLHRLLDAYRTSMNAVHQKSQELITITDTRLFNIFDTCWDCVRRILRI